MIQMQFENLFPSDQFKKSLVPYPFQTLKELNLPDGIIRSLCGTGLPVGSRCRVFYDNPITFYQTPEIKRYPLIPGTYLEIAEMEWVGNISVCLESGEVWQVWPKDFERAFMNSSIGQYIECLGTWIQFYEQFLNQMREIRRNIDLNFNLFDHPEVYDPIRSRLSEIDKKAMESDGNYWPRCCEPDII